MARTVTEWIGKNDDTRAPPRVRARVFEREGGICHLSKRKIMPGEAWELDHKIALINGGENRESNLFPALVGPHKAKTREDVGEKGRIAAIKAKHTRAIMPEAKIASAPMPTTARAAKRQRKPDVIRQSFLYRDI